MFNINLSEFFWWPVKFSVPGGDPGGKLEDMAFEARFRRRTQQQIEQMRKRAETDATDHELARELLVDWREVFDNAGPVAFGAQSLDRMLAIPGASIAIVRAFVEAHSAWEKREAAK